MSNPASMSFLAVVGVKAARRSNCFFSHRSHSGCLVEDIFVCWERVGGWSSQFLELKYEKLMIDLDSTSGPPSAGMDHVTVTVSTSPNLNHGHSSSPRVMHPASCLNLASLHKSPRNCRIHTRFSSLVNIQAGLLRSLRRLTSSVERSQEAGSRSMIG